MTKSCYDCPNYVDPAEATASISPGYGPGVAYCALKGIPLGVAIQTSKEMVELAETMGTACTSHGTARVKLQPKAGHVANVPTPVSIVDRNTAEEPKNCRDCAYFADAKDVKSEFHWPVAMCKAKGVLLPGRRHPHECKNCPFGINTKDLPFDVKAPELDTLIPLAMYGEMKVGPEHAARSTNANWQDPRGLRN